MPWLVKISKDYHDIAYNAIMPICVMDLQLTFEFYYECKFQMLEPYSEKKLSPVFNRFYNLLDKQTIIELKKSDNFIRFINFYVKISLLLINFIKNLFNGLININMFYCHGILKLNVSVFLLKVSKLIQSSTKPGKYHYWFVIIIKKQKVINLLVKLEDVRKDKLTMIVASWIEKICRNYVNIKKYSVFPIDTETGWIEMIDHTSTLYDIKHKYNSSFKFYYGFKP